MTEPKRLVEELRDVPLVRALRAGIELSPPLGAETAVWAALEASVAAGGASLAAPGGAKALSVFGKGFLASKWWLSLFALALVGGGLFALFASRDAGPVALRANVTVKGPIASAPPDARKDRTNDVPRIGLEELEREAPRARDSSVIATASVPSAPSSSPEPASEPAEVTEGELVLDARKALRAGRAGAALELVAKARRDFPFGTLAQERDALEIEALARSGRNEQARERARAFLARYPKSPYVKNVEAVLR